MRQQRPRLALAAGMLAGIASLTSWGQALAEEPYQHPELKLPVQLEPETIAGQDGLTPSDPFATFTAEEILDGKGRPTGSQPAEITRPAQPTGQTIQQATFDPAPVPLGGPALQASQAAAPMSLGSAFGHSGAGNGCASCGTAGCAGCGGTGFTSLVDNMIISFGSGYHRSGGGIDENQIIGATNLLNLTLLSDIPEPDDERLSGYISLNSGIPLTSEGKFGFQIGANYNQAEFGGQGFLTAGFFHRCDPTGGLNLNIGSVYDILVDHFNDSFVGQFRFQIGAAITANDEIGTWFTVVTQSDTGKFSVFTDNGQIPPGVLEDVIETEIKPHSQGHLFWRHVFDFGAESFLFVGKRDRPDEWVYGGTVSFPLSDYWAIQVGGHASDDDETYNIYSGLALSPGGKARVPSACGCRFMPYMDVANNTFLTTKATPKVFRARPDGPNGFPQIPLD